MSIESPTATQVQLLHAVFERQAEATPDALALEVPPGPGASGRVALSYAQLNARAEALADRLAAFVHGESVVAVVLPRSGPDLFIALLGILKAGAAYTVIEPGSPPERLRFLLADSRAVAVVSTEGHRALLEAAGMPPGRLVTPEGAPADRRRTPATWLTPSSLAYVIYTSGTTGHPKGVMIEHRSVANLAEADAEYFDIGPHDRCAQTSSCAYDSSVEEMWLGWAKGATVVVVEDERVRSGPDLLPWLREERISIWCPAPTMLRMTGSDDPVRDLPGVRLVYVGGEELPADVAERWARGRRLENGYGPTETTVTTIRTAVTPGEAVHIGKPMRGHGAFVVDASMREVPDGETGELCITGIGLARGYLGRPDLTAERFLVHEQHGRCYRTGDLVRRRPGSGDYEYLGRADTQVKIRGHRIELTAVESELCQCPGVLDAACRVQNSHGVDELVAFVVTPDGAEPHRDAILETLRRSLPEAMIPSRIARLDVLPRGALSGKLDRRSLPVIESTPPRASRGRAPRGEHESLVAAAFRLHVAVPEAVDAEADFFLDLGGNSLLAAQVVSELRRDPRTAQLTVRDLYETRTVAALATRLGRAAATPRRERDRMREGPRVSPHAGWTVAAMVAFLALGLLVGVNVAWFAAFRLLPAIVSSTGATGFVLLLPALLMATSLGWMLVASALTVLVKRVLIGRYTPGRHPYLGGFHLRHWLVTQCSRALPWELLESTHLRVPLLRALGASIGRDVHFHRGVSFAGGGWDLLSIGDGAALGRDVSLGLVTWHEQQLVIAPVSIGARATLDTRARMAPGSRLGDDAFLSAMGWLAEGASVPAGERWDGVPAQRTGEAPPAPTGATEAPRPGLLERVALLTARASLAWISALPTLAVVLIVLQAWSASPMPRFSELPLVVLAVAVMVGFAAALPLQALLCRLLPRVQPGVYPVRGTTARTVALKERLVESANAALSGTLAWPVWLRWAGMRVGRRCEISTIMEVTPELVHIADDVFFADGIYLGRPLVHRGHLVCDLTSLEPRTFLGNHAIIPAGARLPGDILLGVCTVADPARILPGTSWFGHPAFELPRREKVEADERLTFRPSFIRRLNRALWESARLFIPILPALLLAFWAVTLPGLEAASSTLAFHLAVLPGTVLATGLFLCALTLVAKWTLMGRMREAQHVLWSCWCSRWDLLFEIWSNYARPVVESLDGTPLVSGWLRLMGARIGRRVVLGTSFAQLVDPDMLEIGDDATVSCHLQLHSFEDRVLKLAPSRIGEGATVASGALVLYGAHIGAGVHVAEQSVVMKREHLTSGLEYEGAPTRPVGTGA